jgi:hypothetical protein
MQLDPNPNFGRKYNLEKTEILIMKLIFIIRTAGRDNEPIH